MPMTLIAHHLEGFHGIHILEFLLWPGSRGDIAQVDGRHGPVFGFERLNKLVTPCQAAELRLRAATRLKIAIHLPTNNDGEIGWCIPTDEERQADMSPLWSPRSWALPFWAVSRRIL